MVQFWLNNIIDLVNVKNFNFSGTTNLIQALNILSLIVIIVSIFLTIKKKELNYFIAGVAIVFVIIIIGTNISSFSKGYGNPAGSIVENYFKSNTVTTQPIIRNNQTGMNNTIRINLQSDFKKGDIIGILMNDSDSDTNFQPGVQEVNIISDIQPVSGNNQTANTQEVVLFLLKNIKGEYPAGVTLVKVSDASPVMGDPPPPNGNISIQDDSFNSEQPAFQPKRPPGAMDRQDYDLQQSNMIPGTGDEYQYQGPPYGNLKCRSSTLQNPMGTINVTEYDSPPTMYGTCNGSYGGNDQTMTTNQENTVSQRVNDLLFHRGNSQMQWSPVPVDTLPNNQEQFANFCYNTPSNLINPKYASIFVNDPDKYKLVSRLAKATGTENGGGGGGGGRPS